MNSLLSLIYKWNYHHDQMEPHNRGHEKVQLFCLILVISVLGPMPICLDTNLDYQRTIGLMFGICISIACAIRIPYNMGKLDAYACEESKKQKAAEKEELDDLIEQLNRMQKEMNDIKSGKYFEDLKKQNQEKFFYKDDAYRKSQEQVKPKTQTNDWRMPYLRILGLSAAATANDIKQAYRKLAMKYHPDRNKDPKAEEIFKKIKSAYEALC